MKEGSRKDVFGYAAALCSGVLLAVLFERYGPERREFGVVLPAMALLVVALLALGRRGPVSGDRRDYDDMRSRAQQFKDELTESRAQMKALERAHARLVMLNSSLSLSSDPVGPYVFIQRNRMLFERMLGDVMALTCAHYGVLVLWGDDRGQPVFISRGLGDELAAELRTGELGRRLLQRLEQRQSTLRITELGADGRPAAPVLNGLVGTPLAAAADCQGALYLIDKARGRIFSEDDEAIVNLYGITLAHTLERISMLAELHARNQELSQEREEQRRLIEKLQRMKSHLLQSEKLAGIGQLAAGVAHEINNPVGYIGSNLGSLRRYLEDLFGLIAAYEQEEHGLAPAPAAGIGALKQRIDLDFLKRDARELVDECLEGASRVRKIVKDLKDFSRADKGDWALCDIHAELDSSLNIAHNEIKYKAEVVRRYGALPAIECVASQLGQVFMNIFVNAAQAIERKGTITVATGCCGERVWIEIADTGAGIAPDMLDKIFDPFFTTKPVGAGTGLGLAITYGIVTAHRGTIEVASEPGRGTTFTIRLPIRQCGQEREGAAMDFADAVLGG